MKVIKYVTDISKNKYYEEEELEIKEENLSEWYQIRVIDDEKRQEWLGMGGDITQASTNSFLHLDEDDRKKFLEACFGTNGLNYKYIRIPIGSCDFSPVSYTYLDGEEFSIDKDRELLFPLLKEVVNNYQVSILATPWTPPPKYKTNNSYFGGHLDKKYYNDYANYLIQYLEAYKREGIDINYLSIQNEPLAKQRWESCVWDLNDYKLFMSDYLIPNLSKKKSDCKLILWEHNKEDLYNVVNSIMLDSKYIEGVGFHWYTGSYFEQVRLVREKYPKLMIMETEMCCGYSLYNENKWVQDALLYLKEIIGNINSGLNVFIDWNILLQYNGGVNHKFNYCKSPIILNKYKNDYIETPIYDYLKHLGGIPSGSRVVVSSSYTDDLKVVSFVKDDAKYIIILNVSDELRDYVIPCKDGIIEDTINGYSITTIKIEK